MNEHELDAVDVAFQFVEHINRRELEPLVKLMTADHQFVDLAGDVQAGREIMRTGWADYFARFPDYMIHLSDFFVRGDTVFLVGRTTGSHLQLPRAVEFRDEPVIWRARIDGGRVAEWRLFLDGSAVRQRLGLPAEEAR